MQATVEGTEEAGYIRDEAPDAAILAALANEMAPLRPSEPMAYAVMAATGAKISQVTTSVGRPIDLLLELAAIKTAIRTWFDKQPDEVIREASAYSARLTEVWTELRLLEQTGDRSWTQMRTMQVTPVLDEIDRQYKFQTSRIAMMRQDLEMVKGAGA